MKRHWFEQSACARTLLLCARADVVATKLGIIGLSGVRALHVVRARADVVATKLGIILSFFFLSFFLTCTLLPEGVYLGS